MNKPSRRLAQAQLLHQNGKLDAALAIYQELLNEDPKQADVLHALSILYSQQKNWSQASIAALQAIELEPDTPAFLNTIGLIYANQNKLELSVKQFKSALDLEPNYASAHNNIANQLRKSEQIADAIEHYEKAIELQPNQFDWQYNLALLYLQQDQPQTATQYLKKVLLTTPQHLGATKQLAQLALKQQQFDKAITLYLKALQLAPDNLDCLHDLALAHIQLKQFTEAEEYLEQVTTIDPDYTDVQYHLGIIDLHKGEYTDALSHFLNQIEHKPDIDSYYNIAVLLMYEGREKEAKDYFDHTLSYDNNHRQSWINLGVMALKSHDKRHALNYYQKALKIDPGDHEIAHIVSALQQDNSAEKQAPKQYIKHLFDQYALYYDHHLTDALKYLVPEKLYELLCQQTYIQQNRWSIIDLGCGTGLAAERLAPFADHLVGIDLSPCMIDIAEQKNIYQELHCCDVLEGLKQSETADFIIAADVFTYIGDLSNLITLSYDKLKPQGYLCFSVETNYNCEQYHLLPTIRYSHHPDYLVSLAESCGFDPIESQNIVLRQEQQKPVEGLLMLWQRR